MQDAQVTKSLLSSNVAGFDSQLMEKLDIVICSQSKIETARHLVHVPSDCFAKIFMKHRTLGPMFTWVNNISESTKQIEQGRSVGADKF